MISPIQQIQKEQFEDPDFLKQKAAKSAERRKLEMERREVSKQKTMDRLLKKKDSKVAQQIKTTNSSNARNKFDNYPKITYRICADGQRTLSLAPGMDYPIKKSEAPQNVEIKLCYVCKTNRKKYNCSKTKKPLCSFECYKKNLENEVPIHPTSSDVASRN